jgi:asparagine synthetase B (glutamine-hydrolysing)
MPGIFGGFGCKPEQYEALKNSFDSIWGECESISLPNAFIGGHAFSKDTALHVTNEGLNFAVDGENSLYKNAIQFAQKGKPSLFQLQDHRLEPGVHCKGNIAIVDKDNKTIYLATEWTGSFPLYYTRVEGGLLFSSHLRPLSKAIRATPDPIGIIQIMRDGFILGGRTCFKEIRRLMPGQALTYQPLNKRLTIYESSRAWRDWDGQIDFGELVNETWMTFLNAMRRCLEFSRQHALMASGGWDTRLLLSAFRQLNEDVNLLCYTHGDLKSREISITKQMVEDLGIKHHLEPIDGNMYNLNELQRGFNRVEVVNPPWLRAGARLAEAGVDCVSAGVIGEVIGGRHGRHWPMLPISEWDKIRFVIPYFLHFRSNRMSKSNKDISCFYDLLNSDDINKPWYLRSEYWDAIPNIKEEMDADLEEFVRRLKVRGVENVDKIFEAYTAEYFGAHMLTPQLLTCRAHLNISIPFADQELLNLTSRIPLSFKILHSLQQALLHYKEPNLLKYPNAAAFFNSKLPVHILELSRLFRKKFESIAWKISRVTHGHYKPKSLGWSNYEALSNSQALQNIADDLKSDMLDKNAIKNGILFKIAQIKTNPTMYPLSAMHNQMIDIYAADLMLK